MQPPARCTQLNVSIKKELAGPQQYKSDAAQNALVCNIVTDVVKLFLSLEACKPVRLGPLLHGTRCLAAKSASSMSEDKAGPSTCLAATLICGSLNVQHVVLLCQVCYEEVENAHWR